MAKKVNRLVLAMSRHYPMTIRPLHISVTVTTLSSLEPIVILLLLRLLFTTFRAKSLLYIGPSLHLGPKRITLIGFLLHLGSFATCEAFHEALLGRQFTDDGIFRNGLF